MKVEKINWHNTKFKDILGDNSKTYINEDIKSIFEEIDIKNITKDTKFIELSF